MVELIIRKSTKKDSKEIINIAKRCFPEEDIEAMIEPILSLEHFYIAKLEKDGPVIGFIVFGIYALNTSHILIMAVDTPYQRQGYGTEIMNFALEVINQQSTKKIRLEVRTTNIAAIKFYEKLGFRIIGKLENYYDDQGDAFLMLKELYKKEEKGKKD